MIDRVRDGSMARSRWAAIGAAVAVSFGAGGGLGWFAHADSALSSFVSITPCRLFDLRPPPVGSRGTPLATNETASFQVTGTNGACTIPAGATGIAYNLTVPNPTVSGFIKIFPAEAGAPVASAINPVAGGGTKANSGIVGLSPSGGIKFFNSIGPINAIFDITGYFVAAGGGTAASSSAHFGRQIVSTTKLDTAGDVGKGSSITIGADGNPIIAYRNVPNGDVQVVKCMNVSCSNFNVPRVLEATNNQGLSTSIAIGADGNPIVAYDGFGLLKVVKCTDPACAVFNPPVVLDGSGFVLGYTSIAIGADGNPIIAYLGNVASKLQIVKCTNQACSSFNSPVALDGLGTGWFASITIGADGNPVVAYRNVTDDLKVVKCSNPACSAFGTPVVLDAANQVGYGISITIGVDANPIISYTDVTTFSLKVVKCTSQSCSTFNPPISLDAGQGGGRTSIIIGTDGNPIISYDDLVNEDLRVVQCTNQACSSTATPIALDVAGSVGRDSSITLSGDGNPIISYYDTTNGDLKAVHLSHSSWTPNGWGR